jgi:hypothetical protein
VIVAHLFLLCLHNILAKALDMASKYSSLHKAHSMPPKGLVRYATRVALRYLLSLQGNKA